MKRLIFAGAFAVALAACTTPVNPTLLQDGQLVVAGLTALDGVAVAAGASVADTTLVSNVLSLAQSNLSELQSGTVTPATYVTLIQGDIQQFTPTFLSDIKANASLVAGVEALEGLVPVLTQDVTGTASATAVDPRARLQTWISSVQR
jgi:hypothetical protein